MLNYQQPLESLENMFPQKEKPWCQTNLGKQSDPMGFSQDNSFSRQYFGFSPVRSQRQGATMSAITP